MPWLDLISSVTEDTGEVLTDGAGGTPSGAKFVLRGSGFLGSMTRYRPSPGGSFSNENQTLYNKSSTILDGPITNMFGGGGWHI